MTSFYESLEYYKSVPGFESRYDKELLESLNETYGIYIEPYHIHKKTFGVKSESKYEYEEDFPFINIYKSKHIKYLIKILKGKSDRYSFKYLFVYLKELEKSKYFEALLKAIGKNSNIRQVFIKISFDGSSILQSTSFNRKTFKNITISTSLCRIQLYTPRDLSMPESRNNRDVILSSEANTLKNMWLVYKTLYETIENENEDEEIRLLGDSGFQMTRAYLKVRLNKELFEHRSFKFKIEMKTKISRLPNIF